MTQDGFPLRNVDEAVTEAAPLPDAPVAAPPSAVQASAAEAAVLAEIWRRLEGSSLEGSWVTEVKNYELEVAERLELEHALGRHWDCLLDDPKWPIELKKTGSGSMWFDLVRYSEALREPAKSQQAVTIVLRYSRAQEAVTQAAMITEASLIKALGIDAEMAERLVELRDRVPNSLNAQASLPWSAIDAVSHAVWPHRPAT